MPGGFDRAVADPSGGKIDRDAEGASLQDNLHMIIFSPLKMSGGNLTDRATI